MLLALCHHCWAWIEPKHDRCVECGHTVNLREADPDAAALQALFGPALMVLGEMTINRPKLPAVGCLTAFTHGLLFLPDLRVLPSGGIVPLNAVEEGPSRGKLWKFFSRHHTSGNSQTMEDRPLLPVETAVERFFDSPGALFVRRDTIQRIQQRATTLRIERKPGRTVAFRIESGWPHTAENLRHLITLPAWSKVPTLGIG